MKTRAAILVNAPKWYVGYSIDLFTHNEIRYSSTDFGVNFGRRFRSYWQFGYTFQRSSESKFSFTPQLLFLTNIPAYGDDFRYFGFTALNLNFRYQKVIWGLSNAGLHVGLQTKRLRLMLASTARSGGFSGTSYVGNLSFRYIFKADK